MKKYNRHLLAEVENVKKHHPVQSRVALIRMDAPDAPPEGTRGTVTYIDGMANIHVRWDNGIRKNVVPGIDTVRCLTLAELRGECA